MLSLQQLAAVILYPRGPAENPGQPTPGGDGRLVGLFACPEVEEKCRFQALLGRKVGRRPMAGGQTPLLDRASR